ncbi:MAG: M15 family metallopeptidase [Bacteroidota bacterium]
MARSFLFAIVCSFGFLASSAQTAVIPFAPVEAEIRHDLFQHFSQPFPFRQWEISNDTADAWKRWELVENYSFGKDRGSIPMIADLQSLHPYFRDKILELVRVCRSKGIELAIVETYRTRTKQNEYKAMGRRYTRAAAGSSKHQYGLAVDVVPVKDSVIQWNNIALWKKVGTIGERLGLRWGGRWRRPFDPAHFEWTGGTGTYYLVQGNFPPVPKTQHYPCIDEDLKELQRHWKAWEAEQSLLVKKENARRPLSGGGHD